MALAYRRPYGVYRWFANAPRWLYRLGLGWVLGYRVAQITHRGRKSGQIRRTILEVLHYDPQTHEVLVVSGWEGKTDWYRNIQREPALEVRLGRVHYRPDQEFLSPQETARLILTLFRQHPREVRFVGPLLGIDPDAEDATLRARLEDFFRGVRFRPVRQEVQEISLG
jgi:deazaflavin-dependent oxidoreductase (nitroreductase family)